MTPVLARLAGFWIAVALGSDAQKLPLVARPELMINKDTVAPFARTSL